MQYNMPTRWQFTQAARVVNNGGVIAYPTEAVFGLGCDPYNYAAVQRILKLKQRSAAKGLILIAADLVQLTPFIVELPMAQAKAIHASWPGFTTWVLPAHPSTPRWLTGGRSTIAARVSAHPTVAALCRICNCALVSTSANYSGHPPARNSLQIRRSFKTTIDYLLPGNCDNELQPSRILDAATGRILR